MKIKMVIFILFLNRYLDFTILDEKVLDELEIERKGSTS